MKQAHISLKGTIYAPLGLKITSYFDRLAICFLDYICSQNSIFSKFPYSKATWKKPLQQQKLLQVNGLLRLEIHNFKITYRLKRLNY